MAYSEFCCRSGGSNLNAGTRTGNSSIPGTDADFTYPSMTWAQASRTFTRLDGGSFVTDGIAVGDFVSIYPDAVTIGVYIARVSTVAATTLVTDATAKAGYAPVDGSANTTCKVGGAWKGPNGSSGFPFTLNWFGALRTVGNINHSRINMMNDATYTITTTFTMGDGQYGYTTSGFSTVYGDSGRATIDGGITGASYVLVNVAARSRITNFIFANNGATGSASGIAFVNYNTGEAFNCVVHNVRGHGFDGTLTSLKLVECEAYLCNQSNTANKAGFYSTGTAFFQRCIAHDNSGSNSSGFYSSGNTLFFRCIADTNGQYGFNLSVNTSHVSFCECDAYSNVSDGYFADMGAGNGGHFSIINCNAISNGGWGLRSSTVGTGNIAGHVLMRKFGTFGNTSGTTSIHATNSSDEADGVAYASNPYNAASTGDFRVALASAKNAGRGVFVQTQSSYTGTVGYPDIGAAQHLTSGGVRMVNVKGGVDQ